MPRILPCAMLALLALPAHGATVTVPGSITIVPLDVSVVTTGGVPVMALIANHHTAGGWLANPPTATTYLCISETSVTPGSTSAGSTTCITPGQAYILAPALGPVSVVSSDSGHAFSGQGFQ